MLCSSSSHLDKGIEDVSVQFSKNAIFLVNGLKLQTFRMGYLFFMILCNANLRVLGKLSIA